MCLRYIIANLIQQYTNIKDTTSWNEINSVLPDEMNIDELRLFLSADNSEQQENILQDVYTRLEMAIPEEGVLPQQIRVMTMHGAKGLNADVVIIPGLEEDLLPGAKRSKYTGLIQEGARQLYVSITRARHSVILSFARSREKYGSPDFGRSASRYCDQLNGKFVERGAGLSESEGQAIVQTKSLFTANMSERQASLTVE